MVLLGVVAAGLPVVVRRAVVVPLLALAAVSVLAPAALATGPGLHALRAVVDAAPGFGVLRDGQKWVALAMPGYTLAGAGAVVTLRRWLRPSVAALVCCLALILALPDLAWGAWGKVLAGALPAAGGPRWRRRSTPIRGRSRCCPPAPCGGSRGPARRRCWTRCPAGCEPTC